MEPDNPLAEIAVRPMKGNMLSATYIRKSKVIEVGDLYKSLMSQHFTLFFLRLLIPEYTLR